MRQHSDCRRQADYSMSLTLSTTILYRLTLYAAFAYRGRQFIHLLFLEAGTRIPERTFVSDYRACASTKARLACGQ
jgi:hypothetical protein